MTQDDPTIPLAGTRSKDAAEPFEYGDRTLYFLRNQEFNVAQEFGTMIATPGGHDAAIPLAAGATENVARESERSIEEKIDLMLARMMSIESRLASIDAALARVLNR